MTKLFPFAALVLVACVGARQDVRSELPASSGGRLRAFDLDECYSYLVDTRVQACFLAYNCNDRIAMESIDCGKLAAGVAETASVITWAASPAPAPAQP